MNNRTICAAHKMMEAIIFLEMSSAQEVQDFKDLLAQHEYLCNVSVTEEAVRIEISEM